MRPAPEGPRLAPFARLGAEPARAFPGHRPGMAQDEHPQLPPPPDPSAAHLTLSSWAKFGRQSSDTATSCRCLAKAYAVTKTTHKICVQSCE